MSCNVQQLLEIDDTLEAFSLTRKTLNQPHMAFGEMKTRQ